MRVAEDFLKARDFLLSHRTDYGFACRHFQWPQLHEFNWALDYFDAMAAGNTRPALWVVDESGAEYKLSFAEMSQRSNRVAQFLRELGVRRGDHMLLMLGNDVPLWETLLAACKLGAVVIPAATLLAPEDLQDRLDRGAVRHVIVGAAHTGKFAALGGEYTRICVGGPSAGWHAFEDAQQQSGAFTPEGVTRATDPLLLYFTSGTTAKPKLVHHSHQSYPVGHLSTMYWVGLQPGDVHWNISSPGWAKHAWSCWFAPWNAGATVFAYNYARFNAKAVLAMLARMPITTLCAPPTVWRMLVQEKLGDYAVNLREAVSAGLNWVRGRWRVISATACRAWRSVSGLFARDTNDSIPCVRASSPVVALSQSGMVVSRRGSITEISGTSVRLMMVILLRAAVSVTMANCDTSAPVPEVDGTITVGGIGRTTLSTPS